MEQYNRIKKEIDILKNINFRYDNYYKLSYINLNQFELIEKSLSYLRRIKEIDTRHYHILLSIYRKQYDNYLKIKLLTSIEPRKVAQKFIGKKNIRKFIFDRDGNKCLNCGSLESLTIDHIQPINRGGENKLGNLQTLCHSCNSSKSDTYKDYRK